jgi:DNA-binding NtrC family response regulator
MEFTLESIRDLFVKGQFSTIARATGSDISSLKLFPPDIRVRIAHANVYAGGIQLASALAESVRQLNASPDAVAHSFVVSGLIKKREGDIEKAAADFRGAMRVAKEAGDNVQSAWAHAHLFRLLAVAGYPESHLTAMLGEARRHVSTSGDAHAMAFLHDSVATMEAQRGRTVEAERHLRLARGLVALKPNAWLEEVLAVNASCVAFINCDPDSFGRHLADARSSTRLTGNVSSLAAIDCNEAFTAVLTGRFARASTLFEKILHSPLSIHNELSARESLARMHLAMGHLDACEAELAQLKAYRSVEPFGVPLRAASVLEVRLMITKGEHAAASAFAFSQIQELAKVNDRTSLVALTTLRAVALGLMGDFKGCSHELLNASHMGATSMKELQAEYAHACSLILAHLEPTIVFPFEHRSFQIWSAHGNVCGPLVAITSKGHTVDDDASAQRVIKEHRAKLAKQRLSKARPLTVINHLAAAFDLAYKPELMAHELSQAIELSELSPRVELSKSINVDGDSASLPISTTADKPLTLVCEPPADPFKAILLGDILRIGSAALALERAREEERSRAALWPADPVEDQGDAIFLAEEMQSLLATARRIATTTVPVLITGETGTGKEVLARTIHACSNRASATFLPFNCASTPKDMLDSQLFGHRRGAFTGAVEHFQGVIRAAAGGTLFLDEIGDTGLDVQPKLLRFLEASEVHPIGETQPTRVDVRVIVATNADLETLVRDGRFREDLFYRLSIVRLHLPPLRERRVEIPTLANHYLRKHALEYRKGDLRLSEDTMEYLMLYKWPGNVRQLANEMRRIAALAETSAVLMPEHLSPEITASRRTVPATERTLESTEVVVRLDQPMAAAVRHLEQTMVQYALKKCEGRIEDTAAMLGLSRKGLYLKRLRFGIEAPDSEAATVSVGA